MQEIRDRTFEDEIVILDELKFSNCHFMNCEVRYSGGGFVLEATSLVGCRWSFGGAAQRTLTLMRTLKLPFGEEFQDQYADIWYFSEPIQ